MSTPEPNEIDFMNIGWAAANKELIREGKVSPEAMEAVEDSIKRVKGMFAEFEEWVRRCEVERMLYEAECILGGYEPKDFEDEE